MIKHFEYYFINIKAYYTLFLLSRCPDYLIIFVLNFSNYSLLKISIIINYQYIIHFI